MVAISSCYILIRHCCPFTIVNNTYSCSHMRPPSFCRYFRDSPSGAESKHSRYQGRIRASIAYGKTGSAQRTTGVEITNGIIGTVIGSSAISSTGIAPNTALSIIGPFEVTTAS